MQLKKNKKAPQAQKKARSANPALRRTEAWSSGETLVAREKASEAKRSAPPKVGGADATLRERGRQPWHEVTGERHRAKQSGGSGS